MARHAVLIKGGVFLELAKKMDVLLVDKTGTFTLGRPKVVEVFAFDGMSEEGILRLAAIAEKYSEHPLARSVMTYAKECGVEIPDPDDFNVKAGMGVTAQLDGNRILVGKNKFLQNEGVIVTENIAQRVLEQAELGRTAVLVANDMRPVGLISIADEIRHETPRAIASLKAIGIKN
jgi:P-type E1-E2 ATPase